MSGEGVSKANKGYLEGQPGERESDCRGLSHLSTPAHDGPRCAELLLNEAASGSAVGHAHQNLPS